MTLLQTAKSALRLTTDALDDELNSEVSSCLQCLHLAGIEGAEADPLIQYAVRAYVRWQHDFCGQGDRWERAFNSVRDNMGLSDEYREPGV